MRTALCHEWMTKYGGSEQVAQRLAASLGIHDVYTFAADPALARALFPDHHLRVSPLGRSSLATRHWRLLLPMMARTWAALDLSDYDLVVTSSHAAVNAVGKRSDAALISYCHTPMRYAWDWRSELGRVPVPLRPLWPLAAAGLRAADRRRAQRVTRFIANSRNVADRIDRWYGRDAVVVHPPVDTAFFTPGGARGDFFLHAGRLVAYKRPEVAVDAARRAGVRLVVAGSGPELDRLRRRAGSGVSFVVEPSRERLRDLYRSAIALVAPGVEDFGMMMVEAQACGTPVVALGRGGAREAVVDGRTGLLYEGDSPASLAEALRGFDPSRYAPQELRRHAEGFSSPRFDAAIRRVVGETVAS